MSLTKFLKLKEVKSKFLDFFPKPRFTVKREIVASPITENYSLVGTAFDYLFRFIIEYSFEKIITNKWIAEIALEDLEKFFEVKKEQKELDDPKLKHMYLYYKTVENVILEAKKHHSEFISNGQITERLIESTLLLAQIDPIYRAGVFTENLGSINIKDVKDLENLISSVDLDNFNPKKKCFLNPNFGEASKMVGGADADLIIDDMLIEIKTTKRLEMRRETYNQLIGYYILYRIAGINGMTEINNIKKLGVYFSRYGYLHLYNIEDIIDETIFPEFIQWFKDRASQEYGK